MFTSHEPLNLTAHSLLSNEIQLSSIASTLLLRATPIPAMREEADSGSPEWGRWNFAEELNEDVRWMVGLKFWTWVYSAWAKHHCWPTHISVHALNVGSLKGHRGWESASVGKSGFGGIWMLADEKQNFQWLYHQHCQLWLPMKLIKLGGK